MLRQRLLGAILRPAVAFGETGDVRHMTLLDIPMELGGNWEQSAPADVLAVLGRMRAGCLEGTQLLSDQQPERLRVDDHLTGPPSVWLHSDVPTTAWVVVDARTRDWCNLAYQFGHELGHVFCNSWKRDAAPANPSQWVEEALVEAFSLRGLGRMADGWEREPPFPDDSAYAGSIRQYREAILVRYRAQAAEQGMGAGFAAWFKQRAAHFAEHGGVGDAAGAVPTMLEMFERDPLSVADLGALNRWPGRSGLALPDYLAHWQASCAELGTPNVSPGWISQLLG